MAVKVHLVGNQDKEFISHLRSRISSGISLTTGDKIPNPADFEILVAGVPEKELIETSPNLHTLIIPWAGLPRKTAELMRAYPDIKIHNIHHNAVPTAEMAMTMMLTLAKHLFHVDGEFRKHDWTLRYENSDSQLLRDKKVLVMGYGAIGREIARRCEAFGMEIHAVRKNVTAGAGGKVKFYKTENLSEILPGMEIVFVCLPLTGETKGLLSEKELAALPDGAVLINISRGMIIDEQALYNELRKGRIRAGLDVWYDYPQEEGERKNTPPSKFPFHELENVIMTPHLAGHSNQTERLRAEELARLLNLAAEGQTLTNQVDIEKGY